MQQVAQTFARRSFLISSSYLNKPSLLSSSSSSALMRMNYTTDSTTTTNNNNNAGSEATKNSEQQQQSQTTPKQAESDTAAALAEKDKVIKEQKATISDLTDKYKRALAETENVRERARREVENAKTYGLQNFSKDLLEVIDLMHMATSSIPPEHLKESKEPHLPTLHSGLQMIQTTFNKILNKHGVERFDPKGEKFNPNEHNALFEVPHHPESSQPGHVDSVHKSGYKLHGRVIRPAHVGVVRGKK